MNTHITVYTTVVSFWSHSILHIMLRFYLWAYMVDKMRKESNIYKLSVCSGSVERQERIWSVVGPVLMLRSSGSKCGKLLITFLWPCVNTRFLGDVLPIFSSGSSSNPENLVLQFIQLDQQEIGKQIFVQNVPLSPKVHLFQRKSVRDATSEGASSRCRI